MNDPKLGVLSESAKAGQRDAVHIAIVPLEAAQELFPGEHIGLTIEGKAGKTDVTIGVVDPFLVDPVAQGQWFNMCLYPGSITGLRHHWTHPTFTKFEESISAKLGPLPSNEQVASQLWMQAYAKDIEESYDDLIYHAEDYITRDQYWCEGEKFEGWSLPAEFWTHFYIITGKKGSGSFYSCSC